MTPKALFILHDPPYGTECCYSALRLANAVGKADPDRCVTVLLMADAGLAAKAGQKTPDGYYNMERMLRRPLAGKGEVLLCRTCMYARGLVQADVLEGARRSTLDELAAATLAADKVLVF
jgi:uncharacterized protein involved in oxidation of intracellular sulfur